MIPREHKWHIILTCILLLIAKTQAQGERKYDTGEWIPVTSSPSKSNAPSNQNKEQVASDRILNLDVPLQKFPVSKEYRPTKHEDLQFVRKPVSKINPNPVPRKLKSPSEYKFETPPPPPSRRVPQINYYAGNSSPYLFEQPPIPSASQIVEQVKQNYLASTQQKPNAQALTKTYVPVPSINPEVPPVDSPSVYNQYQSGVNSSYYQSLNPTTINDGLYQSINAINKVNEAIAQNSPSTTIQKTLPILEKHTSSYQAPVQQNQNVQLVYVPVENLKPNQPPPVQQYQAPPQNINQLKPAQAVYSSKIPAREPQQFGFSNLLKSNNFNYNTPSPLKSPVENKQKKLDNIEKDFVQQAYYAHKLQETLQDEINPLYQDGTTAKPKRKAHQPPLALFLESQSEAEVSDALNVLKDAKSIAVQDRLTPHSPSVFIGPSTLEVSEGYTKFPLPYLNNLNGNRIERKIDQLPFFVAPVSYNTPPGYSKIPLPSPHVGSVVVSIPRVPITTTTTRPTYFNPNPFGLNYNGYNFDYQTASPVQNYLNQNYQTYDAETNSFQGTPTTEQPLNVPSSDNGQSSFNVRQQPLYDTRDTLGNQPQRGVKENATPLNTYKPIEENYSRIPQNNYSIPATTPRQTEVKTNTENANSLDLAINNFELQQINNQFGQENRKVKHSTTARPQTISQYDFVSSTVQPLHTQNSYEYNTEAPVRGRVRDRNRGTAKVSTKPPLEEYKYTVLEEFLASMNKPTESYLVEGGFEDTSKLFGNGERTAVSPNQPLDNAKDSEKSKPIPTGALDTSQQLNQGNVNIENIPASVYNLGQQQTYTSLDNTQNSQNLQAVLPINYSPTSVAQDQRESSNLGIVPNDQAGIAQQSTDSQTVPTKRRRLLRKKVQNTNNDVETTAPGRQITSPGFEQAQIPTQQVLVQNINNENFNAPVDSNIPIENFNAPEDSNIATDPNTPINTNVSPDLQEQLKQLAPNLFQPNFDQTYISLQDQAVRTLLTPNALPPAIQEEFVTPLKEKQVISTTETFTEIIPSVEPETEKSTTVRTRTRGRVRGRVSTSPATTTPASTVTSSSRRTSGRRRPAYTRTTTERATPNSEYELKDDSVRTSSNTRQRTRTRGRQSFNHHVTKKPAAVQTAEQQVKEQPLEQTYANVNNEQILQTVPQYTQSDIQEINTPVEANPEINTYNYIPIQTTTARNVLVEYENYNYNPTLSSNIPIQSIPTENVELPLVQEFVEVKPVQNDEVQQYNNANIRSAGILNNNPETTTAKTTPSRARGRTRGRSRFTLSTTTTTTRPVTRPATTAQPEPVANEETEYYGFIRSPNFAQRNIEAQVTPSETVDQPFIQFVGEIRPKYTPTSTTAQAVEELVAVETPRPRVRSRTRAPSSRTTNTYRQTDNEQAISRITEQSTKRPARTRGRGSAHYQGPENVKRGSKEEDVANQNYPVNFLQKFESTAAPQVTTPNFQITIGPNEEEDLLDQSAHSSFYLAKVLPAPNDISDAHGAKKASRNKEYTKTTEENDDNAKLSSENKPEEILDNIEEDESTTKNFDETESLVLITHSPEALPILGTTKKYDTGFSEKEFEEVISDLGSIQTSPIEENVVTTTPNSNSKRRGVWKLVRHEPVEPLEGSESQNYKTVLNDFETIAKVYPYTKKMYSAKKSFTPTTELSNIELVSEENNSDSDENEEKNNEDVITTTNASSIVTEYDQNDEESLTTTTQPTFKTQESIFDSIYEMFGLFNKENQNKTLTEQSTTIPTTTLVNPTFPDEITEESSTSVNINSDKYITKETAENENIPTTTAEVSTRKYDVQPWKMKIIKTSTSTEISHETEICYKGRCVKSKGRKMSK